MSPAQSRSSADDTEALKARIAELTARLEEAEDTLRAIRDGDVDAIVVGSDVYTLDPAAAASNRFRGEMLAQVSDAVIVIDSEQRVTFLNAAAERQYGVNAAEVLGRRLSELHDYRWLQPGDEAAAWAALRERGEWRGENIHITREGRELDVESSVTVLRGPDGVTTGMVAAIRDITGRKRADRALRLSEERMRRAEQAARSGTWDWDLQSGEASWSEAAWEVFGRTSGEATVTFDTWLACVHPDDRTAAAAVVNTARGVGLYRDEYRVLDPDQTVRWVESRGEVVFDAIGQPVRMLGTVQDITARILRNRNLVFLADMQNVFAPLTSAAEIMRSVCERLSEHLRLIHCTLVEVDELAETFTLLHDHAAPGTPSLAIGYRLSDFHSEDERRVLASGAPVVIANVHDGGRTAARAEHFEALGIRAVVNAGYISGGCLRFVLRASRAEPYAWPAEEVKLLTEMAERVYVRVERARAEEELREKEYFLQQITQVTPGVLQVFDLAEKRTVFINRSVASLLGFSPEEVQAMGADVVPSLMHPDDLARFEQHLSDIAMLADGEVADFEHQMRDRAGAWHWFHSHDAVFARDAAGGARQLIGMATEITERKRTEQLLADRTELLGGVLESTTDVIFAKDLNGRILMVNAAFAAAARSTPEQLVGKTDEDWFPPDVAAAVRQQDETVIAGGSPMQFEDTFPVAGEAPRVFLTLKAPLRDGSGRVVGILGIGRDITGRKQAEEALREQKHFLDRITAVTPDVLYVLDITDFQFKWVSQQAANRMGYSAEEIVAMGANFLPRVMHPDDLARMPAHFAELARAADGQTLGIEYRLRQPDGSWRWFGGRKTPFTRDSDGRVREIMGTSADITDRKRSEEAVARLAAIVESSHDALFSENLDGIITSWNPGAEQIFGYRAQEIVGTSIMRLMPASRQAAEHELQRRIVVGELGGTIEAIRLTKDGREFPASITIAPLKDAAGKVIGTSRVLRDITESRRAEEALRENAALFSTLIAQAPMGTYVVDAQFRMRQINAEAMPAFGSVHPLIGRDFQEVVEILWGLELGGQIAGIFRHTLTTGERYVSPPFTERRHDLGIEQTYEWQTQHVTLPDGQNGVVCYFHEVTERAQATAALRANQERMSLAAEATGVGIWEWNVLTNAIRWDALMFRMYGIEPTPDGLVHYQDWSGAVLPEDLAENEAILQDTVRRCGQSTREFRILRRSDGECRWIQAVETVRAHHDGKAEWVLGTNLDVSERVATAEALRIADRRKDEFLATLAHELRNPLAPVRNGLQILRLTKDPDIAHRTQLMMERQLGQMVRLIDDLLEMSRISSGKIILRPERMELQSAVHSAIEATQPQIDAARQVLQLEITSEPIWLNADATRICQVVNNLLTNAAKFSPSGSTIRMSVHREGNEAVVTVADDGEGIPQNMLSDVFEMFTQIDRTLDRAQGGLGIGLALVRRLVELHGGSVTAESAGLGAGSTFTVRLPALADTATAGSNVAPLDDAVEATKLRVLVVDDNVDAAESLAALVSIYGYESRVADSGASALALVREFKPALVLLDIGMPGMNGYETARRIRAEDPSGQVTLAALTGWGAEDDRIKASEAGFDHHFTKPVEPDTVNGILQLVALRQAKLATASTAFSA